MKLSVPLSLFVVRFTHQFSLWLHVVSIFIHIEENQLLQLVVLVVSLVVSSASLWVCRPCSTLEVPDAGLSALLLLYKVHFHETIRRKMQDQKTVSETADAHKAWMLILLSM